MITRVLFKRTIVVFWAAWWAMAFLSDFIGGLNDLGLTKIKWFAAENYPFLSKSLSPFGVPEWLIVLMFIGIIVWSLLSTLLFVFAAITPMSEHDLWLRRADIAFIVSLCLWLAFFLGDQFVMNFDLEENHMVQGAFQLLSYLSIHLLPQD